MQEGNQRERDGISLKKAEKTALRGKPEFLTMLKGLSYNERKGSGGESMIAVWIVAASFTIVGFLYGAPRLYKIIACKGRTTAGCWMQDLHPGPERSRQRRNTSITWMESGMWEIPGGPIMGFSGSDKNIRFGIPPGNRRILLLIGAVCISTAS